MKYLSIFFLCILTTSCDQCNSTNADSSDEIDYTLHLKIVPKELCPNPVNSCGNVMYLVNSSNNFTFNVHYSYTSDQNGQISAPKAFYSKLAPMKEIKLRCNTICTPGAVNTLIDYKIDKASIVD